MSRTVKLGLIVTASAGLLAACSSGGGGTVIGGGGGSPPTPTLADNFGAGFANAFKATFLSEPINPSSSDVIALSATTDPVPVP